MHHCTRRTAALALAALATAAHAGVQLEVGPDLAPRVAARLEQLLEAAPSLGTWTFAVGETPTARALIPEAETADLGDEGFAMRSGVVDGVPVLAVVGAEDGAGGHARAGTTRRGTAYGAYAALETMGFAFMHPLAPTVPARLPQAPPLLDEADAPRWPLRGQHLHTQHPTELVHVLNGWGPAGPEDEAGWRGLLGEWDRTCEWMLANRQNFVEWMLLEGREWREFARSARRQARLAELVRMGQAWGLQVGIDVPVALAQQNAWRLITTPGDEEQQLREGVDWLMVAGFDVVTTELGFSEFHSPDERQMVAWLSELTDYADRRYGREVAVKVHCSVAEKTEDLRDPRTGKRWNMNFLPHFADPRLGVLVHTVQHYGLDDPAPTYGRTDFKEMYDFLKFEAGRRPVVWYPETAYWVSFDVDVPLFLPVYADRRVADLRKIAADEEAGNLGYGPNQGARIQGQMNFSSGWEWGYWLNDVVTARAAWDPHLELPDSESTVRALLKPLADAAGPSGQALVDLVARTGRLQHQLLILGKGEALVGELEPERDAEGLELAEDEDEDWLAAQRLNGQAYLQGVETWDDVSDLIARIPFVRGLATQPRRLGPVSVRGRRASREYVRAVRPLMQAMQRDFGAVADQFAGLVGGVPPAARPLARDLADSARMTALRSRQMHALYDVASRYRRKDKAFKRQRMAEARQALDQAAAVVRRREASYLVDADRVSGWGVNPTVYQFGYLWTVRSLYYWYRDEGKVAQVPRSPCYLNVLNPAEVATAEGTSHPLYKKIDWIVDKLGWAASWAKDCVRPPSDEPNVREWVRGR